MRERDRDRERERERKEVMENNDVLQPPDPCVTKWQMAHCVILRESNPYRQLTWSPFDSIVDDVWHQVRSLHQGPRGEEQTMADGFPRSRPHDSSPMKRKRLYVVHVHVFISLLHLTT